MRSWKLIIFNIAFALNCLLVFLLIFERGVTLPLWLQVGGRMHPLILHFPIVILVLTIFWELLPRNEKFNTAKKPIGDALLLLAAFSSVITSLLGLFLSKEDGYTPDILDWHKWGGVFISLLTLTWYAFRDRVRRAKFLLIPTAGISLIVILVTGHYGANVTHGEDFLLAPLAVEKETPSIALEDAFVYADMVKPIIQLKCISCHNQRKAKGDLVMETEASLLKGGKTGVLWDSTERDFGLIFQRIHLPLEQKKHMPPKGKSQLTEEEIKILYHWVKKGADFNLKVTDLPEKDTLRSIATTLFTTATESYAFEAADEKEVKKLNNNYRVITPLAVGSPALSVEFFSPSQFQSEQLRELLPLKEQVVSLNLNKMPLVGEDLKIVSQFPNLRELNLSFTNIPDTSLAELTRLQKLKLLSLSGTNVKAAGLKGLTVLPALTQLYLWNTAVANTDVEQLKRLLKNTRIETGYKGDTVVIKLNPPVFENEGQIVKKSSPLKLKHYIKGTIIRYTIDGSDPDSLKSAIFKDDIIVDKNLTIKAKAYKEGWFSSDVVERNFYTTGYKPDSIRLFSVPDGDTKDNGTLLIDLETGDLNFRSGKWIGYRHKPLEAFIYFKNSVEVSSFTLSALIDISSYIMPPQTIEIWGGKDASRLKLLKRLSPPQPKKEKPDEKKGYQLTFQPAEINVLKVVANPISRLPSWHPGKGDKAWVFVDEFFIN